MVLPLGGRVGRRQLKYTVQAPGISLRPGLRRLIIIRLLMASSSSPSVSRLELLWWALTCLTILLVLVPLLIKLPEYPFWVMNSIYIATFITATRYIFLLPSTFLARRFWLKTTIIFLSIPVVFFLVQELNEFQTFLDEQGVDAIVGTLPFSEQQSMFKYIRNEMLLFGTGAIISATLLPFRLLIAIWRVRNRKDRI